MRLITLLGTLGFYAVLFPPPVCADDSLIKLNLQVQGSQATLSSPSWTTNASVQYKADLIGQEWTTLMAAPLIVNNTRQITHNLSGSKGFTAF